MTEPTEPDERYKAVADYSPAGLYFGSHKWLGEGYTIDEAVDRYMRLHPEADAQSVRAEIEAAAIRYEFVHRE